MTYSLEVLKILIDFLEATKRFETERLSATPFGTEAIMKDTLDNQVYRIAVEPINDEAL